MNETHQTDYLHIYGQTDWHAKSYIIGDLTALKALRKAIDAAIESGGGKCESFTNDGEGYDTVVIKVEDSKQFAKMQNLQMLFLN